MASSPSVNTSSTSSKVTVGEEAAAAEAVVVAAARVFNDGLRCSFKLEARGDCADFSSSLETKGRTKGVDSAAAVGAEEESDDTGAPDERGGPFDGAGGGIGVSIGPPAGFLPPEPAPPPPTPLLLAAAPGLLLPGSAAAAAAFLLSPSTYAESDALTFADRLLAAGEAEEDGDPSAAEDGAVAGFAMFAAEPMSVCAGGVAVRGDARRVDRICARPGGLHWQTQRTRESQRGRHNGGNGGDATSRRHTGLQRACPSPRAEPLLPRRCVSFYLRLFATAL